MIDPSQATDARQAESRTRPIVGKSKVDRGPAPAPDGVVHEIRVQEAAWGMHKMKEREDLNRENIEN